MDLLLVVARLLLAAVFATAGTTKLRDRAGFQHTLHEFGLPHAPLAIAGIAIPIVELVIAVALLVPPTAWWGAAGALAMLPLFSIAVAYNLIRGRNPQCHCFGQLHSTPVGLADAGPKRGAGARHCACDLARAEPSRRQRAGVDHRLDGCRNRTSVLAIVACAGIGVLAWFFDQLFAQHGRVLVRLDALEQQVATLTAGRQPVGQREPPAGLTVGAPAPTFTLPSLTGQEGVPS